MGPAMIAIEVEDVYVEVLGGRVFVRSWRPEKQDTGSPVALLHDSLGCVDLWRDFPKGFASRLGRTVFAYDPHQIRRQPSLSRAKRNKRIC